MPRKTSQRGVCEGPLVQEQPVSNKPRPWQERPLRLRRPLLALAPCQGFHSAGYLTSQLLTATRTACHLELGELSLLCCLHRQQTERWPPALCHALQRSPAAAPARRANKRTCYWNPDTGPQTSSSVWFACPAILYILSQISGKQAHFNLTIHQKAAHTHRFCTVSVWRQKNLNLKNHQIVFVTNRRKICSTQYTTKKYNRNINLGEKSALRSYSIRIDVLHGSRTLEKVNSQVTDSLQLLRDTWQHESFGNQQQWILWLYKAKKPKNSGHKFDSGLEEPHPDGWRTESTRLMCAPLLCFYFVHKNWIQLRILGRIIVN